MDMVLISTFVVSGLVLIINIWFRQLERSGREELLAKLDPIMLWLYPLLYVVGGVVVYLIFFPPI